MENNIVHQYTQNVNKESPGGTAILWKKEINHLIKVIQDGNKCLQCIEILDNNYKPLLIIPRAAMIWRNLKKMLINFSKYTRYTV